MSEQRVFLVQVLCPQRHAILAFAYEYNLGMTEEEQRERAHGIKHQVEDMIAQGSLDPWCALCGASKETWRFDTAPTRFRTMVEAEPHLRAVEAENQRTRDLFRAASRAARN